MKILVTGFNPFATDKVNPAIEVVKKLPEEIAGAEIIKLEIPTEFIKCTEITHQVILEKKPDYILSIGQAGGRFAVTPEKVAINLDDGKMPDNAGYRPLNHKIRKDGQTAYFTELPVKAIVQAIKNAGLPSYVSTSAGTYVCNHIMYQVQYFIDKEFPNLKAGFIHIPFLPNQIINRPNSPSLSLIDDIRAITIAIETIINYDGKKDLKIIN
ncbi:pyroglutamyl-peptidase I [Lactobacillus acetotolerans]|jgi:pyroglutamyl-peptidase|uniref:pyroglutamyl-peptidase I n=1 Tax=Lactobacillus acetotolerans TaxID=1600 RepID=UPI000E8D4782|nr:pyroglutamyl-peptidase I [Lactobacillus acetotolerans]HBG91734.1 pyroglutamyl-peptidase I [Lactobacillus acetotolerans]